MKKIGLALLLLALIALSAYPRGKKGGVPEGKGSEKGLVLWVYDDGRLKVLTQLGEKFKKKYGVGVKVEVVGLDEIKTAMSLGGSAKDGPDMVIIPHDNLGPMVAAGAAAPIDLGDKANKFLPNAVKAFTLKGKLYGVPLAVENIGFFRNTKMVPKAPKTWDEVAKIGKALVAGGKAESAIGLPDLTYNSYPLYTSYGGYIFGRDAGGNFTPDDIGMDNKGMVQGLSWIQKMVKNGGISKNVDWESSHVMFETGKSPFIMTGPWALVRFKKAGVPYAISEFPAAKKGGKPGYPFMGVQGIVINANKKNVMLAKVFAVEFLPSTENFQAIFNAEPRPSAWKEVFENSGDKDTKGFNAAGVNADPMPAIPAMGFVWDAWNNAGALVVQGDLSPQQALKKAVKQINAQIKKK